MEFEFGDTQESQAFFDRNPKFMTTFLRLADLTNKYLGGRALPGNQVGGVCFGLAHACRQDFLEAVFLAVNGYGGGASKITRGLYERSVTLAYIVKYPKKAERFVRYAAVQEHRSLEAALKVVSEAQFDALIGQPNTAAEIRARYQKVKPEFEMTLCKKCGTKRVQPSWDADLATMVCDLGGDYQKFYLPNYSVPNFAIHATLSSAMLREGNEESHREADLQVACASFLLLLTLQSLESIFKLGLEKEIGECVQGVNNLRPERNEI